MTHDERVYHHMYETCEGIGEHAERIARLEELVLDLWGELFMAGLEAVCAGGDYDLPEGLMKETNALGLELRDARAHRRL